MNIRTAFMLFTVLFCTAKILNLTDTSWQWLIGFTIGWLVFELVKFLLKGYFLMKITNHKKEVSRKVVISRIDEQRRLYEQRMKNHK